jgi:xanthine dehydrogenase YagT iron-sulfur-binding subunit
MRLAEGSRAQREGTTMPAIPVKAALGAAPGDHVTRLNVNGQALTLDVAPWTSLLDLLRERLKLTGSKKGCDHGQCGACTVLVEGERMNACLLLAVSLDGAAVTTVEGLPAYHQGGAASADGLHPLQQSFIDCDALQCGYCTPGQLCSAAGLLNEHRPVNRHEIRERMSGNLCRCGAYPQIVDAVARVVLGPGSARPAITAAAAAMVATAEETGEVRE